MKRPLVIALIGYILGIIWGLYFKKSIVLFIIPIYIIVYISIKLILKNKEIRYKRGVVYIRYVKKCLNPILVLIVAISSILSNTIVIIKNNRFDSLYKNIEDVEVVGTVVSNVKEKQYKYVYKVKVEKVNGNSSFNNTYIHLNIPKKNNKNKKTDNSSLDKIEFGDLILFEGLYTKPAEKRNYMGFSYKDYLKTVNIYGDIKLDGEVQIIKNNNINIIWRLSNLFNKKIEQILSVTLPEKTSALLLGILIGDTKDIEKDVTEDFKDSNLAHMLAVSGSHISYIILSMVFITDKIKSGKRLSKILTCIILMFFMYITGFSPSVVRACIMGIIIMISGLLYRKQDIWTSISFSLFIILLANPFSIKDIGLILSFGGTIRNNSIL